MELRMTWLKFIKVSLFLFCTKSSAYSLYQVCDYRYTYEQTTLCSPTPLLKGEISSVIKTQDRTQAIYQRFLRSRGLDWRPNTGDITVFIVPFHILNNKKFFSRPEGQDLYGRYITVDRKMFTYPGSTELDKAHEFAHYQNELMNLPIEQDEELAYAFEKYYLNYYDL